MTLRCVFAILTHYLLTPYKRSLSSYTNFQLVKKLPAFYGTRRFITTFTSARHLSLSSASSIHSIPSTSHFLKKHFNIILPSTPGSPKWALSLIKALYTPVLFSVRATCTANLILLDFIARKIFGEQSLSSSLCSLLYSIVTSSLLGPNILLSTLFSYTHSLRFSLNISDQVSHPYKTTGKVIVLYFLIFKFLDSKLEDKRFCTE